MPMSSLTTRQVLHLSKLANLSLSKAEIKAMSRQLSEVLNYFEQLNQLRVDEVSPTSQTTGLTNVLRADEVNSLQVLTNDEATSGTEKVHNGAFVVPQVLDK